MSFVLYLVVVIAVVCCYYYCFGSIGAFLDIIVVVFAGVVGAVVAAIGAAIGAAIVAAVAAQAKSHCPVPTRLSRLSPQTTTTVPPAVALLIYEISNALVCPFFFSFFGSFLVLLKS